MPQARAGQQTAGQDQGEGVTDGAVRLPLLFPTQAQTDIGGTSVSQHQCHSIDQNGQRERDISGCHSCNAHALSDKDLIHDVIEVVDHQCQ